jgi:NAD(P)H dehydrogenase (quinone)
MSTIAVTGASGQLGRLVVKRLKEKRAGSIIALARSPVKVADLGVTVREFDYDKPEIMDRALRGVDTLLFISASEIGKRLAQHMNVIAASKKAGVKWIVYTSLLHADRSPLSLAGEHFPTEEAIRASGIPFTILRNGWYTENYLGSLKGAIAAGTMIGSVGDGKVSAASRIDFAEAAVAVLTGSGHHGKYYELAGDHAFTLHELAAEVSKQGGKRVVYKSMSEADYAAALAGFGLPQPVAEAIASWDVGASKDALFDDSGTLSRLIGRPTTLLSAVVARAMETVAK